MSEDKMREARKKAELVHQTELESLIKCEANWRQRAESAESKLKELSEQEPYFYLCCPPDEDSSVYIDGGFTDDCLRLLNDGWKVKKLYAAPIPSPEVAELQSRIAEFEKDAKRYRWLRMQAYPFGTGVWKSLNTLDKECDAAIAKEE